MKPIILFTPLFAGILLATSAGTAQTAAGGGGAGARVSPGPRPFSPATTVPPNGTVTTQPQNPNVLQPSFGSQTNITIATNPAAMVTNGLQGTNPLTGNTNGGNSNFVLGNHAVTPSDRQLLANLVQGVENQLGINSPRRLPVHFIINNGAVTITGVVPNADQSQRIMAQVQQTPGVLNVFNDLRIGNAETAATQNQQDFFTTVSDHAFTPADQRLLTAVQQQSAAQLGINGSSAVQMPIHFSIENGVVGVIGQLASLPEKEAVLAAIQRIPGVVRVVDDIGLTGPATGGVNATVGNQNFNQNPFLNSSNLPPTSRNPNQTNMFSNPTNGLGF